MYFIKKIICFFCLAVISCGHGGPLTPAEAFKNIQSAVERQDPEAIAGNISSAGIDKIGRLKDLISGLKTEQLDLVSSRFGYSPGKLRKMSSSDAVYLYFFSDRTGVMLGRYFKENIVSIDIQGDRAVIKTESGIELDFIREGPYWKFDISEL